MSMRHGIVISCLGLSLALATGAAAQSAEQERERAANQARELERLVNQLRQVAADGQLQASQGGGRGGRTGGTGVVLFDWTRSDPMSGPVVTNAPFSADAITLVTQTLGDGTNISQRTTAKFYRDSTGRIRREQTIIGLDALNPRAPGQPQTVITLDSEPADPRPSQLDPIARTVRRVPRASAASPGGVNVGLTFRTVGGVVNNWLGADQLDQPVNFQGLTIPRRGIPSDLRPTEEQLGSRQIEGIKATGRRTTVTIPIDRVGNDRPIQITDERWDSPELGIVLYSRYSDPRTGIVEYRLTSINRSEPRADLFTVPADYTVVGQPAGGGRGRSGGPAPLAPQAPDALSPRGGGAGGRGQRQGGPPQQ